MRPFVGAFKSKCKVKRKDSSAKTKQNENNDKNFPHLLSAALIKTETYKLLVNTE